MSSLYIVRLSTIVAQKVAIEKSNSNHIKLAERKFKDAARRDKYELDNKMTTTSTIVRGGRVREDDYEEPDHTAAIATSAIATRQ